MEKLEIKDNSLSFLLKVSLAAFFVFLSSYIVRELEWQEGQFQYYFFKTKIYYGQYNKIVFPVYYWGFLGIVYLIGRRLDFVKNTKQYLREYIRIGFSFHIVLALTTKYQETLFDFTLTPLFFKPPPYSFFYERLFFFLVFTLYYFFIAQRIEVLKLPSNIRKTTTPDLIAFFSLLIVPFFVKDKLIFLGYMASGFGLSFFVGYFENSKNLEFFKKSFFVRHWPIIVIAALSVFFRLWYARYFVSIGDKAVGIGADGPAYFQSALAFSEWNLKKIDFWHSPLYAFYLSFFLFLFGKGIGTVFYCQALVGACAPVIIYLAAKSLWGNRIGFLSGVLTALSHLCIHYSVVINRASPLTVIFPLILLVYLRLKDEKSCLFLTLLGILVSSSFYIGPESLFAVFGVLIIVFFRHRTNVLSWGIGGGKWVVLGVLVVVIPINSISFFANERLIPFGRDSSGSNLSSSTFIYSSSPSALKMKELGFEPVNNFKDSIEVFLEAPWKISTLLIGKLIDELPGFLFDPGGRFLMPFHLTLDSFYGANLQFYIYFLLSLGFILFLKDKNITWSNKAIILSLVVLYILFSSLIIMGTFRFRAVITPINMIFIAVALNYVFINQKKTLESRKKNGLSNTKNVKPFFLKLGLIFFLSGTFVIIFKYSQNIPEGRETIELAQWKTFKKKIADTGILTINSNIFIHYDFSGIDLNKKSNFKFFTKVCRDLFPGRKPYYRIFFDGEFIGPSRKIPSGCSEIIENFSPKYSKGIIGMVAFISDDGKVENPEPFLIKENGINGDAIMVPVVQNLDKFKNEDLKNINRLFLKYSRGLIKISKPRISFNS